MFFGLSYFVSTRETKKRYFFSNFFVTWRLEDLDSEICVQREAIKAKIC